MSTLSLEHQPTILTSHRMNSDLVISRNFTPYSLTLMIMLYQALQDLFTITIVSHVIFYVALEHFTWENDHFTCKIKKPFARYAFCSEVACEVSGLHVKVHFPCEMITSYVKRRNASHIESKFHMWNRK